MSRSDVLPPDSQLHTYAKPQDFLDCFSVTVDNAWAANVATMPEIAALIVETEVPGAEQLVKLRNLIVKPLGLKTSDDMSQQSGPSSPQNMQVGDRVGFFKIYSIERNEIILGEDDVHQDFRVSLFRAPGDPTTLYLATCCQRHNLFGHLYLAAILPFHKMIVKGMLDGAARKLSAAGDGAVATG